jgi:uncharacterized protein (DUF488 family)
MPGSPGRSRVPRRKNAPGRRTPRRRVPARRSSPRPVPPLRSKSRATAARKVRRRGPRTTVFTIGYQGRTVPELIRRLASDRVQLVLDVRELPRSRKPGFSQGPLSAALARAQIAYEHLPALGTPKSIRDRYKAGGSIEEFRRAYTEHLRHQPTALAQLAQRVRDRRSTLLCFERDPAACHRSVLAARLGRNGMVVGHE